MIVAGVERRSDFDYEIAEEQEQAGIYTLGEYLADVHRRGLMAELPLQFQEEGVCPEVDGHPGTMLRLTAAAGVVSFVLVWEQHDFSAVT